MITRRIIPCLDIKNGRTVKGTNFTNLKDAGDPIELAKRYADKGADELVFLDITATLEKRKTLIHLVRKVGHELDIPFTVGGGINSIDLVDELLDNGADKVSVNSAAVKNPLLLTDISNKYGSQCLVLAIDANLVEGTWNVFTKSGTFDTGLKLIDWALSAEKIGVGEILFTAMNRDGSKSGFEIDALNKLSEVLSIPVIASGGAGEIDHFIELFSKTRVSGGLAASIFHFNEIEIGELKKSIASHNILIRT
jgi:cyclase